MPVIKKAIQQALEALPKIILRKLLDRKLKEAGAEIPSQAIIDLTDHILSGKRSSFTWHDPSDKKVTHFKLEFTEKDIQEINEAVTKALEAIPKAALAASDQISRKIFKRICSNWSTEQALQKHEAKEFLDHIEERWGEGLDYLRMLLTSCREIGQKTVQRHNKSKSKRHMYRRWVLLRLHVRACQVTDEIICLMENGFADGAMARWRTLHELSVVASLIADGNEDLAERYILHDAVEVKRQADDYDATQVALEYSSISKRERKAIDHEYKIVIDKYGTTFAHPYGWAAKHLNQKKPTFKELQIAAGHAGMNTYYKIASFNIHAGSRSMFFNLSSMGDSDILLAGRSNAGLVEPGVRTAYTLVLITNFYVGDTQNIDQLTTMNCILNIRDSVAPALHKTNKKLLSEERIRNKKTRERLVNRSK